MKRWIAAFCAALTLALALPGRAEGAGMDLARRVVGGDVTFDPAGYPAVWITPVFDEHILAEVDLEAYPAKFLSFAAPANGGLVRYRYDESVFLNLDALVAYYYQAYDKASFELFLEGAAPENIRSDGADGVAMYVEPDNLRACAMISLKEQFGGMAKLCVGVEGFARNTTVGQIAELLKREVQRVQAEMAVREPGHFWSEGRFDTVEIGAAYDPFTAVVDASGLTVTGIDRDKLIAKAADGHMVKGVEIALGAYSYAHQQGDAANAALKDGTPYKRYGTEYSGYAGFTLSEEGKLGPVYLTIKIDGDTAEFEQKLEETYARIKVGRGNP